MGGREAAVAGELRVPEACRGQSAERFPCCWGGSPEEISTGPTEDIREAAVMEEADTPKKRGYKKGMESSRLPHGAALLQGSVHSNLKDRTYP